MHIFASTGKNVELKPFTDTLNNLNVYEQFLKFYLNQGCEIYIRDYSYLGFPTFRIYIPKYSDVFYEEGENAVTSYQTIERLKQFFYQTNTPSKYDSIKKSLHMIHELSRYNMKVPNSRFHGIMFYKSEKTDWLQDSYKVYVEALLRSAKDEEIFEFLYGKQEKNLYAYLRSMCKLSSLSLESRSAFLDLLCYDADDKGEKEFPQCNIGCTNCIYVTSCAYDCWKRLFEILQKEKKSFVCSDNIQKMTRSILQM